MNEKVVWWSNFKEQNSRGCPGERVKGLLVLSVSCVLGTASASGKRAQRAISLKEPVASGGNRPRHQYSNARERILLPQGKTDRGERIPSSKRGRSRRCSEAFEGRLPTLCRAHRRETRERGGGGSCLRSLLSSLAPYRDPTYLQ